MIARAVSVDATSDQESAVFLGVDKSWVLCQILAFNRDSALGVLERLIEINCMVFNFNQLVLVWLYRKLYLNVLLKFLSAVNLVEDELIVKCVTNYFLEFLSVRFEFLVHLEDIFLAIDDVHKLRFEDLLLHPEVDR